MAIYYFNATIVSRARGQSVVACAAYRAADKLYDQRYDKEHDYQRKQGVEHSEILLPKGAPSWMGDREKLWNAVEQVEKRHDSQLAREAKFSLPRELSLQENISLAREYISHVFVSKGMVADFSIHVDRASDGGLQPHAHVLLTQREVLDNGFGNKVREWNKKENLLVWRKELAEHENYHLALNGHDLRVDHRTLQEQGIDLIPQIKLGATTARGRMESYQQYLDNARHNGERLLQRPEIVFDVLTKQQSTFTHHDIARIVNRYTVGEAQFLAVYEKAKASNEIVFLGQDDKGLARYTTKEMLALESEMISTAKSLHDNKGHRCDMDSAAVSSAHGLSPEQTKALEHIVEEGDLKCIVGFAGTGKSRMLGAANEFWKQNDYRVLGAALSGIAAENLENSSGIPSRTLASRLHYWEKGEEQLTSKDVLIIDETGMVGSRQMAQVLSYVIGQGAKIVLVGDPEQLQAILAGAAFRAIMERTSFVELIEIWRQSEAWQKGATVEFATGDTASALCRYLEHHNVHAHDTQANAKEALISAWNSARLEDNTKSQLILAYTRNDAYELNQMARAVRQSLGEIGEGHAIETERGGRIFSEGDPIYFLKNDRGLGVKNGTLGTIVAIDGGRLKVEVRKEGEQHSQIVSFDIGQYNSLDHGYAATVHKSQGTTVDQTFVLASQYLDRHATYVAMTRHKESGQLFWSKEEFGSQDNMLLTLSKERAKSTSLDYDVPGFALHRGIGLDDANLICDKNDLFDKENQKSLSDIHVDTAPLETHKNDENRPEWYNDLFDGLKPKDNKKEDFSDLFLGLENKKGMTKEEMADLFYGRTDVDFSQNKQYGHEKGNEIIDEKEIDF